MFRRQPRVDPSADDAERAFERARARLTSHDWPPELIAALERLRGVQPAHLVGGSVRDVLLGREAGTDYDVATSLDPAEVTRRFARVEPLGIAHGTVLIVEGDLRIESTTLRREGAYPDARHPERVEFTEDPIEDLGRRDLTINALAYDPIGCVLLDPHHGSLDLERQVLRAVGDPRARFHEDALRPLRVARFAATLGFEPEPATRAALGSALDRSSRVALERVRSELERMLVAERPSSGIELLREAGLLALWLPELDRCYGVIQNRHHAWDVYDHSLRTCDAAPAEKPRVRWAALLHDVGKPDTRIERRGDATFYDHERVGAELTDRALERLRFPSDERRAIVHLVREHMFDYRPEWTDAALRRWLRRVGVDAVADLFDLRIADYLGNGLRAPGFPIYLEELRERIQREIAAERALSVRALAVSGHDVQRVLGIAPGPEVGRTLDRLLDEVIENPDVNQRERLLERLETQRKFRGAAGADAS